MITLSLFSGIGLMDLGLERAGFKTVAFCEIEPFCQKVLSKHWPDVPIFSNIKTLSKDKLEQHNIRNIECIIGGFPCQPFSVAGKKRADKDDRDLWPEMFRVITEIRPAWIIGENVANFTDLAFTRTKINLESIGYKVQPFIIPACAVGAQHRRDRIWIIANANSYPIWEQSKQLIRSNGETITRQPSKVETSTNAYSNGFRREADATKKKESEWWAKAALDFGSWWEAESRMGRAVYGSSEGLDRYRRDRIKALGNSVVPHIPEILGRYIYDSIRESERRDKKTRGN